MFVLLLFPGVSLAVLVAFSVLYWKFRRTKRFWKDKRVPCAEPVFLAGNFSEAGSKSLALIFRDLYETGKKERFFGIFQFTVPILIFIDLELVKKVLVSDFGHFDDRGLYLDEETDPLSVNLLTMGGTPWRNLRTKLNPAFTAGKLKVMFPYLLECGEELTRVLKVFAEKEEVVEFKELLARFTTDVISSCAFGIESNSMKDESAIFRLMGKKVFQPSWEVLWRNFVGFLFPGFTRFFKIGIYPKQLTEFFIKVIKETMNYREEKNIRRNDILQMLIQLKNEGFIAETETESKADDDLLRKEKEETFSYEQAAAQAFIFFTAGFETCSTTMQYALYELSADRTIQDRARKEMQEVVAKHNGRVTYDAVQEMSYLNRIVEETLRKYPPAANVNRVCTKEYRIPGTDVVLEKGTQVTVSILGLHRDDRYYPEPMKFDPERFTEEQKALRPQYTYMPFGEGPRICIGQRFGLTQLKVGLISILLHYKVSFSEKTQIPPIYDPKSFFSAPKGGMHLKISLLRDRENQNGDSR